MSNVRFKCPFCGQISEGSTQYIGTASACPSCGKRFVLTPLAKAMSPKRNAFGCYLEMLKRYFCFRGRTPRREFWWAMLIQLIATFAFAFIDGMLLYGNEDQSGLIIGIYVLATIIPLTAMQVRRLHDTNKSGWWVFLLSLPVLNLAYLVWLATAGDTGKNRFGEDPK